MGWTMLKVDTIIKVNSLLSNLICPSHIKFTSLSNMKHVFIIVVILIFGLATKASASERVQIKNMF